MVIAVVAMLSSAHAEPAAQTYSQAMAEGSRQTAAKEFRAATTAFKAALDARPDDPRALAELSWAQFLAGELDSAEQAASAASYAASGAQLRAMAYYNLGRIQGARGDATSAQAAYAASLDLRDNPEVRARLKALTPAVFTAHRMLGPFATPEMFCKTPCDVERGDGSPTWRKPVALGGPFRDAVKITAEDPRGGYPLASVAVLRDDGWYVLPEIGEAVRGHGGDHAVELRSVGTRLVVDWHAEVGRFGHHDARSMFVCGIGAGVAPSCVGPLVLEQAIYIDRCGKDVDCTTRATYSLWFRCRAELRGDVVEVTGDRRPIESDDPRAELERPRPGICDALPIAGRHALTF